MPPSSAVDGRNSWLTPADDFAANPEREIGLVVCFKVAVGVQRTPLNPPAARARACVTLPAANQSGLRPQLLERQYLWDMRSHAKDSVQLRSSQSLRFSSLQSDTILLIRRRSFANMHRPKQTVLLPFKSTATFDYHMTHTSCPIHFDIIYEWRKTKTIPYHSYSVTYFVRLQNRNQYLPYFAYK